MLSINLSFKCTTSSCTEDGHNKCTSGVCKCGTVNACTGTTPYCVDSTDSGTSAAAGKLSTLEDTAGTPRCSVSSPYSNIHHSYLITVTYIAPHLITNIICIFL